jgi:tetratricopeptide (TPR) repeat protein
MSVLGWLWLTRRGGPPAPTADARPSAAALFAAGDLDGAIAAARAAWLDDAAPDALVTWVRALVYRSYSEYDRAPDRAAALAAAERAAQRYPDSPDILAAYAFALQAAGQPAAAADQARAVLERAPDHALARTALALAYAVAGSPAVAQRESQRVVDTLAARGALAADDALDALRALSISYGDQGAYAQAEAVIERALAINPRLLALLYERARFAMQRGDTDSATIAYYQVLVYSPENVKARYRLCEVSSILREHAAAVTYCGGVIARAPGWADGWYLLGREYFLDGQMRAAIEHLAQCTRLQISQNVPVTERRFECWYLQGQAAEIVGDCDHLLAAYREYQAMKAQAAAAGTPLAQTWVYPPEGPPGCPPGV